MKKILEKPELKEVIGGDLPEFTLFTPGGAIISFQPAVQKGDLIQLLVINPNGDVVVDRTF